MKETNNILEFSSLMETQTFKFKECGKDITDNFINSLDKNDMFSCHCRDFIKYLKFKRCDKHFREAFSQFLDKNKIKYVISSNTLSADKINNFFNAEKIVWENMDKTTYLGGGKTDRQFYEWMAKECGKTFEQVVQTHIETTKRFSMVEIKLDKQQLNGSFNGGCWLTLWKYN